MHLQKLLKKPFICISAVTVPSFWCSILLCYSFAWIFNDVGAQNTCLLNRNAVGRCTPYADCTVLKDKIIFPNDNCQSGTICCPENSVASTKPAPNLVAISSVSELTLKPKWSSAPALTIPENSHILLIPLTTPLPMLNNVNEATFNLEFYRRLGMTFGEKYNIYKHPNNTHTTDQQFNFTSLNLGSNVSTLATTETFSTTEDPSQLINKFHPLGLEILRSQKCGFVYPNTSSVEADILEFPWLALLEYKDVNESRRFACGGSLITESWVLTAAYCIKPELISVRLGEYEISKHSKKDCSHGKAIKTCTHYMDFKISTIVTHYGYEQRTGAKNIALIKLKTRARRNKNIKPICLPVKSEMLHTTHEANSLTVAGWGITEKGLSSSILKKHFISQQPTAVCKLAHPAIKANISKLCLRSENNLASQPCADVGGPIIKLIKDDTEFYTQIGVSQVGGEESSTFYGENVFDSMDWITKVIGEGK